MSDWIEADEAAEQLGRTPRQLLRYAMSGRVRTRQQGRRKQYHSADIEQLAGELEDTTRTRPVNVAPEVGRALVEVVGVQRELIATQRELLEAKSEIARLRSEIERQRSHYLAVIRRLLAQKK